MNHEKDYLRAHAYSMAKELPSPLALDRKPKT